MVAEGILLLKNILRYFEFDIWTSRYINGDRFPEKDKTTVYCQIHYEWETIKHLYTEDGIKYWMQNLKYFERISR